VKGKTENKTEQQKREKTFTAPPEFINIRVNPSLITDAIENGYIAPLALYYKLRSRYIYGRIPNGPELKTRLAAFAGLSVPTVNKYITILKRLRLLTEDRHGYALAVTNNCKRVKIQVHTRANVNDFKQQLYAVALHDLAQQQLIKQQLTDFVRNDRFSGNDTPNKQTFRAALSVRYVANSLNISVNTARKTLAYLNAKQVIRTETSDSRLVMTNCGSDKLQSIVGAGYCHKYVLSGNMFEIAPARHDFLIHPLQRRPMTLKRYHKLMKSPQLRQLVNYMQLTENQ